MSERPAWLDAIREHAINAQVSNNHMRVEPEEQLALLALVETLAGALEAVNEHIYAASLRQLVDEAIAQYREGPK